MAHRLFPKLTATPLQATAYLGGIALFSISFLVFLNSTISFVVTDVIGKHEHVGNDVGTLGFADELLALVACPLWGLLSDRIGVRRVAVTGYIIVGASLILLVKSTSVYPELLLGRLGFSLGGAACSTMVTAVLPAMVAKRTDTDIEETGTAPKNVHNEEGHTGANGRAARLIEEERPGRNGSIGHGPSPSVSSEITITPGRYSSQSRTRSRDERHEATTTPDESASDATSGTSQLAGLVGFFTGAGALVALLLFLPLPAYFQDRGEDRPQSVRISFYIVGAIAFCVALFIFGGLRNLPGENEKFFSNLWRQPYDETTHRDERGQLHITLTPAPSYLKLVAESLKLGFTDSSIGLGYLGGFVARASSVGISLFIPLFVNAYFVRNGLCTSNPDNLTDIKENCKRAYTLASALTGIAETAALICAPLFGWLGGKVVNGRSEWPLLGAAAVGVGGYVAFGMLRNPDAFHSEGGRWAFLAVIMIGISQIGSIVCSLGLLGRGISRNSPSPDGRPSTSGTMTVGDHHTGASEGAETAPLLPQRSNATDQLSRDRSHLKGSIAGVYSFAGGAGILLLTKLGGALFDSWTAGAPFFMLAIFNGILFVAVALVGAVNAVKASRNGIGQRGDHDT
ncbi:major facilitator superfamily MFS-1 [Hortaea werneckii]|nr:major facilitator superfamily MFS-1 [Hortaea werneckii]